MTMIDPGSATRAPLIQRIKNLLLEPRSEWPRIAAEPETIASLYTNYIVPVAGFAVLCTFIRDLLGVSIMGITYKPTYGQAVMSAVWQYGVQLGGVFVLALIMAFLAPRFGGENNRLNALKLAGYAATAGWLANVFILIPWLGFLTMLGLYSLYLISTGAPVLLGIPQQKALPFTASLVAVGIVLSLVVFGVLSMLRPSEGSRIQAEAERHAIEIGRNVEAGNNVTAGKEEVPRSDSSTSESAPAEEDNSSSGGGISLPGIGGLEALTKRLEKFSKGSDDLPPIAPADFKELLPSSLPGDFSRTEISSSETGLEGMNMATVSAVYGHGDKSITLSISDVGMAGAMAGLTGAFGASSSEEGEGKYSKMKTIDGRMTMEEFDSNAQTGTYSFLLADRVMVKAQGQGGASIEDLKAAAQAVDTGRIEALARK